MPETAPALFVSQVARYGDRTALRQFASGSGGSALSWREWGEAVRAFAAALVAASHGEGETAAVFAGNRLLWPIADLGILSAGLTSVGIYPTSAAVQVRQVLADSGATLVVVDTHERLEKVLAVRAALPRLRTIICEQGRAAGAGVVGWDDWLAGGVGTLHAGDGAAAELASRLERIRPKSPALLIYTSGSTGEPKGACIPHRYLLASAASIRDTLGLTDADRSLSYLPYCHAAERVFGLYTRVLCGMEAMLVEDHGEIWKAARSYSPTLFGGLPRFFEKVYEALQVERERANGQERGRWERVLELGRTRSSLRQNGAEVPAALEVEWRRAGEPLFQRVHEHFGARLRLATSGGAPLPLPVAATLDAMGVTVLGAYGMTEHLCVASYRPASYTFDGVGWAMPGTELRVAEDGEVLVRRGPLTFSGYLGRPEETREAFTPDGEWLCTGDLGAVDGRGVLRITGRKKELIALSTGKKIAPLPIESRLAADPWIAQAMLYGEGCKFVTALLTLRQPVVEAWAREQGVTLDYPALLSHPEVRARVEGAVARVNAALSRTEQIRRYVVLEHELSAERDELTPTLKVRRPVVAEAYRDRLETLYR